MKLRNASFAAKHKEADEKVMVTVRQPTPSEMYVQMP